MQVFYSWQHDLDNKVNRNFIKEALKLAIKKINKNLLIEEPERQVKLDHDTNGVPGTPDIVSTIFHKVSNSTVFIADVSYVGMSNTKYLPNPNVMIELGYAMAKLGSDRIICVMNTKYGEPDLLPFDLKQKRHPIQYKLGEDDSEKSTIKSKLVNDFVSALEPILSIESCRHKSPELSSNPSSDEIIDVIMASDSKDDWKSTSSDEKDIHYFKKYVSLRFEIDYSDGAEHSKDFQELWATKHPDPKATSYWCNLYYNSTLIDKYVLVSVDGGRAMLPLPKSRTELTVDPLSYKIAQIHDSIMTLEQYMRRSGLSVKNDD